MLRDALQSFMVTHFPKEHAFPGLMSDWRSIGIDFDGFEGLSDEDKISDDDDKGYRKPKEPLFNIRPRGEDNPFLSSNSFQFESVNQDGASSTWSSVLEETKELLRLHGNTAAATCATHEAKPPPKGSRNKNKHKFSFGFHSEACLPSTEIDQNEKSSEIHQDFRGLEELEHGNEKHSMTELLEGLHKDNKKQPECQQISFELSTGEHKVTEHPMSVLLEGLLQNHSPHRDTPIMNKETRGIRSARTAKRSRSCWAYKAHDKGDLSDPMDCMSSSDEETEKLQLQVYDQDQWKYSSLEINGKTMSDKFQDVLNAAPIHNQLMLLATSKQTGIGYFGRLQQVLQTEKERHTEFLNQPKAGIIDEVRSIDVKILSRYLDAKLTVCHCSLGVIVKSPLMFDVTEEKRTVIFSSRVCNNVELEIGNFIRIHPPWKEGRSCKQRCCHYFVYIFLPDVYLTKLS